MVKNELIKVYYNALTYVFAVNIKHLIFNTTEGENGVCIFAALILVTSM